MPGFCIKQKKKNKQKDHKPQRGQVTERNASWGHNQEGVQAADGLKKKENLNSQKCCFEVLQ